MFSAFSRFISSIRGRWMPPEPPVVPETPVVNPHQELQQRLIHEVGELFRSHGARVELADDWIKIDDGRLMASVLVRSQAVDCIVADFVFVPLSEEVIIEPLAGMGRSTLEGLIQDLLRNFLDSTFHVVFATFLDHSCDHFELERWSFPGGVRPVHMGWVVTRSNRPNDSGDALWPGVDHIQRMMEAHGIPSGLHWMRIYYANLPGREPIVEVALDNEPVPALAEKVIGHPWPGRDHFYSCRLFVIFPPEDHHDALPSDISGREASD